MVLLKVELFFFGAIRIFCNVHGVKISSYQKLSTSYDYPFYGYRGRQW